MSALTYKVVDQNFLREPNPALHNFLSAGNFAVFPDDAAMEMYKGNAITNLQRSLEIISKYPQQVVILKKTQTVARLTQRGNKRLRRLLIDWKQTANFSAFCGQIYRIDPKRLSPELAQIERMGREAHDFIQKRMESTKLILKAIGEFSEAFPPDELRELRADAGYSQALYERMLKHILITIARLMKGHGFFLKDARLGEGQLPFQILLSWLLACDEVDRKRRICEFAD